MNIAIIDDQEDIRYAVEKILNKEGHNCYEFSGNEEDLVDGLKVFDVELIILDMMLGDNLTGIDIIKIIRDSGIIIPIIMITAYTTPSNMIKASQFGIIDIIPKPFGKEDILQIVNKYISIDLKRKATVDFNYEEDEFIGSYETMQDVYKNIGLASKSKSNILIIGETGTGKELVAKLIHKNSDKEKEPFLAINCSSIPENLFEKLMYGRVANFSKNQNSADKGYVQKVGKGTLFLDEIDMLDISLQTKLLRFLETKSFYPLGSSEEFKFNGRIICASSKNKEQLEDSNYFRSDLYYRISTLEITIPNLKNRQNDIKDLSLHFIKKYCVDLNINQKSIDEDAISYLKKYNFKGNVRELKNIIYKTIMGSRNENISLQDIKQSIKSNNIEDSKIIQNMCQDIFNIYELKGLDKLFNDIEKEILGLAIKKYQNYSQVASMFDISRNTLKAKLQKYNIRL